MKTNERANIGNQAHLRLVSAGDQLLATCGELNTPERRAEDAKDEALVEDLRNHLIERISEELEVSDEFSEDGSPYQCIEEQTIKLDIDGDFVAGWALMRAWDKTSLRGAVNNGWLKWSGDVTEIGRDGAVVTLKVDVGGEG